MYQQDRFQVIRKKIFFNNSYPAMTWVATICDQPHDRKIEAEIVWVSLKGIIEWD